MSAFDRRDNVDAPAPGERLAGLFAQLARLIGTEIHVAAPGTVDAYDATTQRARVVLGYLAVEDPADPLAPEVPDPPMAIPNVRVAFPAAGDAYDTWPVAKGTTGTLIFADRALDEWYRKGVATDPVDGRAHSLADAVFVLGPRPDAGILPATDLLARVIEAGTIKLGRNAAQFVALANLVQAQFDTLKTALTTAAVFAGDGGATYKANIAAALSAWPASVAATKVKAE